MFELRNFWIQRQPHIPFYTLAAASYIDAVGSGSKEAYCRKAEAYNPILQDRFGWLHNLVSEALAKHLEAPVQNDSRYALPGFHIFLSHEYFRRSSTASVHFDLQYQLLEWGTAEEVDFTKPLSFTLAISLPPNGAGLYLWDITRQEALGISQAEMDRLIMDRKKTFVPYKPGSLVLHSGHSIHQIAPMFDQDPDTERVTLQGHAIFCRGEWRVYW